MGLGNFEVDGVQSFSGSLGGVQLRVAPCLNMMAGHHRRGMPEPTGSHR